MNNFTFIHKLRNKIRVDSTTNIILGNNLKIIHCNIYVKGNNNTISIDDNSILRNTKLEIVGNNCSIKIGKDCMIGDNCYLSAKENNTHLSIGDDCGLSRNVKVMTSDGHPIFQNNIRINDAKNVEIQNHIWIADNVTILKGVTICNGSVVGINSTVTRTIPAQCIAVGNPAIAVKQNIYWKS